MLRVTSSVKRGVRVRVPSMGRKKINACRTLIGRILKHLLSIIPILNGPIAPMVEQHPVKMSCPGSSPGGSAKCSL